MPNLQTVFGIESGFADTTLRIPLRVLHGSPVHREFEGDVEQIDDTLRVIRGGDIDAYQAVHTQDASAGLSELSHEAYERMLKMVHASRKRLMRIWNFVPNILETEKDQERYRLFNTGRFNAMREQGELELPAATGIGSDGGPLIIEMLATSNPVIHLQNPLQIPSEKYSRAYGQDPPLFSRGTFHHARHPELHVSGTASVRGEKSVHARNVARQTETTLENIRALISRENLKAHDIRHPGFALENMRDIRVFLKNPDDMHAVRSLMGKHFGEPELITYLKDDICRQDLLVEIEGRCTKDL